MKAGDSYTFDCCECGTEECAVYVSGKRRLFCAPCRAKRDRQSRREKYRRSDLKKNYGMTVADYDRMLEAQDHRCAICGSREPGGKGRLHVDHDHASGEVRGLLCHWCNLMLGHGKDEPFRLIQAFRYLGGHAESVSS